MIVEIALGHSDRVGIRPLVDDVHRCNDNVTYDATPCTGIDQLPEVDTCVRADSRGSTIERVAASRHWFIRNQWPEWVQIGSTPDCIAGLIECSLVYQIDDSTQRPKPQSQKLLFEWQPET